MNVEAALEAIAIVLANKTGKQLTGLEQQILQAAWQGDTYSALGYSRSGGLQLAHGQPLFRHHL
ncbi:MAG: hypothetical protein AAGG51_23360 [Cyanobacteria bacterium P01_G01_bin.54]